MCGIGTYRFAFRKTSLLGDAVIVEQCSECGDYRKTVESDIEYVD